MSHHMYGKLAAVWPLVSPVEDYEEEAAEYTRRLRAAAPDARTVLELGSGGGNNAFFMKQHFTLTLSDLSEHMLAVSRALNPELDHVAGDMRSLRLGTTFDAVFVHDAIDLMTTEADLAAVFATAFAHLRSGGVALFAPDHVKERYQPSTDHGGVDGPDGSGVRYVEWTFPLSEHHGVAHYAFVIRRPDGQVEHATDAQAFGLFPQATWTALLTMAGFGVEVIEEQTAEAREPRLLFLGRRP